MSREAYDPTGHVRVDRCRVRPCVPRGAHTRTLLVCEVPAAEWEAGTEEARAGLDRPIESITTEEIELWRRSLRGLSNRSKNKLLIQLHGIFRRAQTVWALPVNPLARVEKHPMRPSGDIQVFSPEEVWALVRAADSEQDAAIYLTAAFTGLRMGELLALRWRDVDFAGAAVRVRASWAANEVTTPKSGKVRAVPLAPDVAEALAKLGDRVDWVGQDDLVVAGLAGDHLDGSALRRRHEDALARAGLHALRFHDLRHTSGTRMIAKADIRRVQEWMDHADIQTYGVDQVGRPSSRPAAKSRRTSACRR